MRERALWRVLPYLRPHVAKVVFITLSAFVSIASPARDPARREGRDRRPDHGRRQASGLVPLFALDGRAGVPRARADVPRAAICSRVVATDVETQLRNDFYEHLQRLEVGFHDRWQSGQLLSRASSDISLIRRFAVVRRDLPARHRRRGAGDLRRCCSILYVPLALLTMATAIPVLVLCRRFERNYHEVVRRIQDQTGDLTTAIEESAKGIRVIKAFGRERRDVRALRRAVPGAARHATRTGASPHALHLGARARSRTSRSRRCCSPARSPSSRAASPSAASSRSSRTS